MVDRQNKSPIEKSEQKVLNWSFDELLKVLVTLPVGYDGQNVQRQLADNLNYKVVTDGALTYIGCSAPGTDETAAKWQVLKIDTTNGTVLTYADGNSNFDNSVTDMASLF